MLTIKQQGSKYHDKFRLIAEINVTPMVDVMLVLLIIFMVAAPLLATGVQVDLPRVSTSPLRMEDKPVTVTINGHGQVFVQEAPVILEELGAHLISVASRNLEVRIFVRGDKTVLYGKIMDVIGIITTAGFSKVALVADLPEITSPSLKNRKGSS